MNKLEHVKYVITLNCASYESLPSEKDIEDVNDAILESIFKENGNMTVDINIEKKK